MTAKPAACIACSIFRREIEALQGAAPLAMTVRYLGSMLHMAPEKLEGQLHALIQGFNKHSRFRLD